MQLICIRIYNSNRFQTEIVFVCKIQSSQLNRHISLGTDLSQCTPLYTFNRKKPVELAHRRKLLTCSQKCQWCTSIHLFLEYQYHHKFLKLISHFSFLLHFSIFSTDKQCNIYFVNCVRP